MTENTWTDRDLPVLRAVVDLFEETGNKPRATAVVTRTGLDHDTVQRALRALYREPYFEEGTVAAGPAGVILVGKPTGDAFRIAGKWPSPENQLDRLVAAIEGAAADESRGEDERGRFRQTALALRGAAYQIAIGALGGAGGNMMTGG